MAATGEHPLQVVANKMKIGKAERRFAEGKWWLVAPLTTIPADGILNGSKGPGFYPSAETQATVGAWDGMPLTAYHPMDEGGRHTSAGHPGVLDRQGIGIVRDSVWNGKLQHKGWFDEERTRQVNPTIYHNLVHRIPIETSTGLYTDNEVAPKGSNHNGRPYTWTARNYRPDHIAVLPDQVGACSLNDGCGVLVNVAGNTSHSTLVTNQAVVMDHWVENSCDCGGKCGKCKPSLNSLTINPFVSESQRRACYAADDPNWDCEEWNDATPKGKKLPDRKGTNRPSVENLSLGSLGRLHTRPSLLQLTSNAYDPNEARGEGGRWTYTGAAGDRGKTLHKHSQAAHEATTELAAEHGKHITGALGTSEAATRESSIGNHASASKYHLAAATQLSQAANVVGKNSFWNSATLGLVGRKGNKEAADKIRGAATKHMYAGGEAGGSGGFGDANKLTEDAHEASKGADKHKVAWLHHAAVNAHLKASQAWRDEADKQGDEGLKKVLGTIAAEHQNQAWKHGKSASEAEISGSPKTAPKGADTKKYEFLKPSTNQLGLKPSLIEVENFNPFHDTLGKFASVGGAVGTKVGLSLGKLGKTPHDPVDRGAKLGKTAGRLAGVALGTPFALAAGTAGVSIATLLGGPVGAYKYLTKKPPLPPPPKPNPYKPSVAPTNPARAGQFGAGKWTQEYEGAVGSTAAKGVHAFSLEAQNAATAKAINLLVTGDGPLSGINSTQLAYREAQLGNHGAAAEGHVQAAELLQKAADGLKSPELKALHEHAAKASNENLNASQAWADKAAVETDPDEKKAMLKTAADYMRIAKEVAPLRPKDLAKLGDKDKQALLLEKAAAKNRIAAIMQGNSPLTQDAREKSLKALTSVKTALTKDTAYRHSYAAKTSNAAKLAWEDLIAGEHNPLYKKTYEELATRHAELAKYHNEAVLQKAHTLKGSAEEPEGE